MNNSETEYRGGRFYQYRPDVKGRDLQTLLERSVFCCSLKNQNDPFEAAALTAMDDDDQQSKYLDSGVACFCRSLTNPLLWAHYANKHAGFVVAFDKEHPKFIGEPNKDSILFDVKYEDVLPFRDHFPNVNEFRFEAMRTKPTCWAYEQEVRLFFSPGNQKFKMPEESIKEVIFGARMFAERKQEIVDAVSNAGMNVRFGEMEYLQQGYGVTMKWL